jgi:hypothetical protein
LGVNHQPSTINHHDPQVTGPGGKRIWQAADKSEETFSFEADAVRVVLLKSLTMHAGSQGWGKGARACLMILCIPSLVMSTRTFFPVPSQNGDYELCIGNGVGGRVDDGVVRRVGFSFRTDVLVDEDIASEGARHVLVDCRGV